MVVRRVFSVFVKLVFLAVINFIAEGNVVGFYLDNLVGDISVVHRSIFHRCRLGDWRIAVRVFRIFLVCLVGLCLVSIPVGTFG